MSHHYSRVKIASGHAEIYFAYISCFLSPWMLVPWKQEHCSMQSFISATLSLAATILSASYLEVAVSWPSVGSSADPIIIFRIFIMCSCQPPPLQPWRLKVEVKRFFYYICSGDRKQPAIRKEPTTCGGRDGEKGGEWWGGDRQKWPRADLHKEWAGRGSCLSREHLWLWKSGNALQKEEVDRGRWWGG